MVVCESVPRQTSGNAHPSRVSTTRARCSRLTWCMMPLPGGTTWNCRSARLAPAEEPVALGVAFVLDLDVAGGGVGRAEHVGDHGVVDHQLGGNRGLTRCRVRRRCARWRRASPRDRPAPAPRWCRAGTPASATGRSRCRTTAASPSHASPRSGRRVTAGAVLGAQQVLQHDPDAVGQAIGRQAGEAVDAVARVPDDEFAGGAEAVHAAGDGSDAFGQLRRRRRAPRWYRRGCRARAARGRRAPGRLVGGAPGDPPGTLSPRNTPRRGGSGAADPSSAGCRSAGILARRGSTPRWRGVLGRCSAARISSGDTAKICSRVPTGASGERHALGEAMSSLCRGRTQRDRSRRPPAARWPGARSRCARRARTGRSHRGRRAAGEHAGEHVHHE